MTPEEYYAYIESLAEKHAMVLHTEQQRHYFRGELEEFYTDLRNKVHFPAVIAESFELSYIDEEKTRETSFIIANSYKGSQNWPNIYASMALCERIGDEFLRRMLSDAEDSDTICANIEPVSAIPLLDEQHLYVGVRYTIRVESAFDYSVDEEQWLDLSIHNID